MRFPRSSKATLALVLIGLVVSVGRADLPTRDELNAAVSSCLAKLPEHAFDPADPDGHVLEAERWAGCLFEAWTMMATRTQGEIDSEEDRATKRGYKRILKRNEHWNRRLALALVETGKAQGAQPDETLPAIAAAQTGVADLYFLTVGVNRNLFRRLQDASALWRGRFEEDMRNEAADLAAAMRI